jgi:glycerophosphoryl diester phosphodiesterase
VRKGLRKLLKFLSFAAIICVLILGITYVYFASQTGEKAVEKEIFKTSKASVLVFAHRGGGGLYPENTLEAFRYSVEMKVDVLELDVHATSDGKLVVFHDSSVDRTTNGAGKIKEITLEELKKLDAAFQLSTDDGQSFPFRGKNIAIPTLEEVFNAFPEMTFNIEPKQSEPSIVKPLCSQLREKKMVSKAIVGSFNQAVIDEFRQECPEVATSASPSEGSEFIAYQKSGLSQSYTPLMQALQVPEQIAGVPIVTQDFVESAHKLNLKVHVWTINEIVDMQRLIELKVDGIMTDYPDRLLELLSSKKKLPK